MKIKWSNLITYVIIIGLGLAFWYAIVAKFLYLLNRQ